MSTAKTQQSVMTTNKNQSFGYAKENYSKHKESDIKPSYGRDWILNGANNYNFKRYKDAYDDSPTHASIINAYVSYMFGEGLVDLRKGTDLDKYISQEDALLMCRDLKINGGFSYQVIWNKSTEPKPLKIKYVSIAKLGIRYDESQDYDVNGYWYSYDWNNRYRYKPKFYPKFTGEYKNNPLEIGYYRLPTDEPFFPLPDYFSGLQWAEVEGEQANAAINHFKNAMSDITVINYNGGEIVDPKAAKEEADKRREQIVGTNNQSAVIIAFNDGAENGTTVDRVSPPELNNQNVFYAEEAEKKIIVAHSAPPILFMGSNSGSGFSSNADEIAMATKMLYRKNINPLRNVLLRGLRDVFWLIDNTIKLDFKDFDSEENLDNTNNTETKQAVALEPINNETLLTGNEGLDTKTLEAQASLKGSVGGVQALLDIQASYSAGTTTYESAIAMLDIIFGYNEDQSKKLLGNPEKTQANDNFIFKK